MTNDDMQKFGKESLQAMTSLGGWTRSAQAIAVEIVDYSKKSFAGSAAALEKILGAKSLDQAMDMQSEYLRSAYGDFVAEASKLSELYLDLAQEMYGPFEVAFAKAAAMK